MKKHKPYLLYLSDQFSTFAGWWLKRKYNCSEREILTMQSVYECINWIALTNEFDERQGQLVIDYVNQDDLAEHLKLIKRCLPMIPLEMIVIVDDEALQEAMHTVLNQEQIFDVKLETSRVLIEMFP